MGSGVKWVNIVKKYSKEEFEREVLAVVCTQEDANFVEERMIGDLWKADPLCMNLMPGGGSAGGEDHPNWGRPGYWIGKKNPEHSKRMSGENHPMWGKPGYWAGKKRPEVSGENNCNYWTGKKNPEHSKKMLGENNPNAKSITIDGIEYSIIKQAAEHIGIKYQTMYSRLHQNYYIQISQNEYKSKV